MHDDHMSDCRVGVEGGADLVPARRHVIALVDLGAGAAEIVESLGDALAIGAIDQQYVLDEINTHILLSPAIDTPCCFLPDGARAAWC